MQLAIMKPAEARLTDILSLGIKTKIHSFKIAGTAGVSLNSNNTAPTGQLSYTGTASQIKYTLVSQHEIVFVVYLDHDIGGFNIGNVMLFLEPAVTGGTPIPFLWMSLSNVTNKNDSDLGAYIIGNRVMLHATVWFPYIVSALYLNQHEELVVRLDSWANEKVIPSVETAEFPQLVIGTHTEYDAATMAIKDSARGYWWGAAFSQFIDDPRIGHISGGIVTQPYGSPSDVIFYDGRTYKVDNGNFDVHDGGANWIIANEPSLNGGNY